MRNWADSETLLFLLDGNVESFRLILPVKGSDVVLGLRGVVPIFLLLTPFIVDDDCLRVSDDG